MSEMAPLAIVQARMASTRLPGKMLLPLGGDALVVRAWKLARHAFGPTNVVVATVENAANAPMIALLRERGAEVFAWRGPEADVLSRFYVCAHSYRWHPASVIVRVTPDDPWKDPRAMRDVAAGLRLPVEQGGEAFTLAQLDYAFQHASQREHLTHALFDVEPPRASPAHPSGVWTIDTREDYEAAVAYLGNREKWA